jgi:hypothetical protein
LLLAAAVLSAMSACQHQTMKHPDTVTELEMKKDVDLGLILDTTKPLYLTIPITNRAKRTVTIQKLAKDCSCTSVKIDKFRLDPGEVATLTIVTNLTGKTNSYEGNVIIESDALERISQIRVRGRITGQIRGVFLRRPESHRRAQAARNQPHDIGLRGHGRPCPGSNEEDLLQFSNRPGHLELR